MLEDNPDDAFLIQKVLQKADLILETKVVATKSEFIETLDSFQPDLIISDHQLPQFSSYEALEISRKKFQTIPFILVTGAVSEEFAAAIIKAGADDYLLKANIKRLPTAIVQVIEKKKTQESLRRSEQQQRSTELELIDAHKRLFFHIENTPVGYIEWDSQMFVKSWSKRAQDIFGWSEQELLQSRKNAASFIYDVDFQETSKVLEQLLSGTVDRNKSQNRNYTKDGRVIWCDWFNSVMKNEAGEVMIIMSMVQDITAQKTVETILKEYNDRYEILSRATNDAIWDWSVDQDLEVWNHGIQTIFGYREREIFSTKKWRKAKIHPDDYEHVTKSVKDAFVSRATNWTSQYQYLCADGSYKHVLDRGYIIYHEARPVRMIGAMQDISNQKEFENQITNIARELSSLIETSNVPIFGVDRNGYINEWNKITAELSASSKNEMLEKKLVPLLAEEIQQQMNDMLQKVFLGQSIQNYELPFPNKRGEQVILLISISPRMNVDQNIYGAICVGQDITELFRYRQGLENIVKERTQDLKAALQKEKELVDLKSKFVSIASHEFRTPLSIISLSAAVLKKHREKISSADYAAKIETIEKQVNHMTYLLDDILVIGKVDAGKIVTNFSPIQIEAFFTQAARDVEQSYGTHKIKIRFTATRKEFDCDGKLLRNILINLLTNAVISNYVKDIYLTVSATPERIKFDVEDKGIGISEEDIKDIFNAFHRGGNVGVIQGTGLGLSIVKKAVEILNGEITVSSRVGKGTIFTVTLPT